MMRVACVQLCSGLERDKNVAQTAAFIHQAADAGATFIATPEMTNVVDLKPRRLVDNLPFEQGLEERGVFAKLAKERGIYILIGSMAVALNKDAGARQAANRSYLFGPDGTELCHYDKLHMFDVDLPNGESWKESSIYKPGQQASVVTVGDFKLGMTICYDVRFPHLYRRLAQAGAEVIAVPAAFTAQTGRVHWEVLLRARAIETGSFIIAPAQGGSHEDGRETWGHSMIVAPWGEVIALKDDAAPGFITADIDIAAVSQARQQIPNLKLDRSFEINHIE